MATCPVCGSRQIISLIAPRQSVCGDCASAWILEDGEQHLLSTAALVPFLPAEEPRAERPVTRRQRRRHHKAS